MYTLMQMLLKHRDCFNCYWLLFSFFLHGKPFLALYYMIIFFNDTKFFTVEEYLNWVRTQYHQHHWEYKQIYTFICFKRTKCCWGFWESRVMFCNLCGIFFYYYSLLKFIDDFWRMAVLFTYNNFVMKFSYLFYMILIKAWDMT